MSSSQKVYVIDSVDKGDPMGKSSVLYAPGETAGSGGAARGRASKPVARLSADVDRIDERGSPALALLAYLAGPLAIFATRRGRSSGFWRAAAIASCCGAAAFALRAAGVLSSPSGAFEANSLLWLLGACAAIVAGFAAWARGAYLLGRCKGPLVRRLPPFVRGSQAAGLLGLAVPGFGLYTAGHPHRAVCALWNACLLLVSIALLSQSPGLWRMNRAAGILSVPPDVLEHALIVLAAIALLCGAGWIVQALDGARLAGSGPDGETRPHGDLAAMALLIAVAAFSIFFHPARLARDIDRFGVAARQEGMRIIPLCASSAAMRLDPSRTEYVLEAIESNESLGRMERAAALRVELAQRWEPYARSLRLAGGR